MSLIRQIWLLVIGLVVLAFLGSFAVWMVSARGYLETQLQLKNNDNAQSLALTLSQQRGEASLMELVVAAQFDTGYYRSIRLLGVDGRPLVERESDGAGVAGVPQWFVQLVPVSSPAGVAQVSDGWKALGTVEVVSHSSFAYTQLWRGSLQTALWLVVLGAGAGLVAAWGVGRIRRPLAATVGQAQALMDRKFITVKEPSVPELARLSRAMNAVVMRLKAVFDEQAGQVEALRLQAHCDPLTGLSRRRHFLGQLDALLAREDGPGEGALVLVRLLHLADVNREWGHRRTDDLLQSLARVLAEARCEHIAGRLNGGDFALCVGAPELSVQGDEGGAAPAALAASIMGRLQQVCEGFDPQAQVVGAAVPWQRGMDKAAVLSAADEALARAESRGAFAIEASAKAAGTQAMLGADEWRRRIARAVAERRARLLRFPLVDHGGRLLHLECPLRLQLHEDHEPGAAEGQQSAAFWLPLALRTGLMPAVDELAVSMALDAIATDGTERGVNLSPASLADSRFLPRLRALLADQPHAAKMLWLEVPESAAVERFELVRELCNQLHPLGVRVGLEHAGEKLARIDHLFEAGLDYIKLDASVTSGVAEDADRSTHVKSMTAMLHSLGLQVYAEGVREATDVPALWACGLDGVTGPAVAG